MTAPYSRTPILSADSLGAAIAGRRAFLGLSLQDLANASGLSKQHVHELETGKSTNPSVSTLISIGASLGVSAHTLFRAAVNGLEEDASGSRVRVYAAAPRAQDQASDATPSIAQCLICGSSWEGRGTCPNASHPSHNARRMRLRNIGKRGRPITKVRALLESETKGAG